MLKLDKCGMLRVQTGILLSSRTQNHFIVQTHYTLFTNLLRGKLKCSQSIEHCEKSNISTA